MRIRSRCCALLLYLGCCIYGYRYAAAQDLPDSLQTGSFPDSAALQTDTPGRESIQKALSVRYMNPDSSILYAGIAVTQYLSTGNYKGVINALSLSGLTETDRGNYQNALERFRAALNYCRYIPAHERSAFLGIVFNNMALPYHYQGMYATAAYYQYRVIMALKQDRPVDSLKLAVAYSNLGSTLKNTGMYESGDYYYRLSSEIAIQNGLYGLQALLYANRGGSMLAEAKPDEALPFLHHSIYLIRTYEDLDKGPVSHFLEAEQVALRGLGRAYIELKQPDSAAYFYRKILANPSFQTVHNIAALYGLGHALFAKGEYRQAANIIHGALEESQRNGLMENRTYAHELLSEIHEKLGHYQTALLHRRSFDTIKEQLYGREQLLKNHQLELRLRTEERDKDIATQQLLIARQQNAIQQKNIWLISISALSALIILMLLGRYHHKKQKEYILRLNAVMRGEENERIRISRELHDGIGGMLAAIRMNFWSLRKRFETQIENRENRPERILSGFDKISSMLHDTCSEVRETAHNLMPDILTRHGLSEAVRQYLYKAETDSLRLELQLNGNPDSLPSSFALYVYRIIQELVQNIIRHSGATQAVIQINSFDQRFNLIIEDNGNGLPADHEAGGAGLRNIRSRVRMLGGSFSIQSTPDSGTNVYIMIHTGKQKNSIS